MKDILNEKDIKKLVEAIEKVKDIEAAVVLTTGSFAAIGKTIDLMAVFAGGLQQLLDSGVFTKREVDMIVECLDFSKDKDKDKKEIIKRFMDAIGVTKEEIEEALNEEK